MEIIRFVNGEKVTQERLRTLSGSHPQLVSAVRQVRRRMQEPPRLQKQTPARGNRAE